MILELICMSHLEQLIRRRLCIQLKIRVAVEKTDIAEKVCYYKLMGMSSRISVWMR
jgi:hypothetical protein